MLHLSTRNTAINLLVFLFPFRLFFLRLSLSFHTDVLTTSATVGHSTRNHTATPANTVAATILSVLPRHASLVKCLCKGLSQVGKQKPWGYSLLGIACMVLENCPLRQVDLNERLKW